MNSLSKTAILLTEGAHVVQCLISRREWLAKHSTIGRFVYRMNLISGAIAIIWIMVQLLNDVINPVLPYDDYPMVLFLGINLLIVGLSFYASGGVIDKVPNKYCRIWEPRQLSLVRLGVIFSSIWSWHSVGGFHSFKNHRAGYVITLIGCVSWLNSIVALTMPYIVYSSQTSDNNRKDSMITTIRTKGHTLWKSLTFGKVTHLFTNRGILTNLKEHVPKLNDKSMVHNLSEVLRDEFNKNLRKDKPLPLWRILLKFRKEEIASCLVLKLIYDATMCLTPVLINRLIKQLSQISATYETDSIYTRKDTLIKGFYLVFFMGIVKFISCTLLQVYFYATATIGYDLSNGLTDLIYRKSVIGADDGRKMDPSTLVNVDCDRINNFSNFGIILVTGPIQICVAIVELWYLMGVGGLVALLVMCLTVPTTKFLSRILIKRQRKVMEFKDRRSNLFSEVLQNMQMIKFDALESCFNKRINDIREKELDAYFSARVVNVTQTTMMYSSPEIVNLLTFVSFALIFDQQLTPDLVFTAVVLFDLLRFIFNMLPTVISQAMDAYVSSERLEQFLTCPDVPASPEITSDGASSNIGIVLNKGDYYYPGLRLSKMFSLSDDLVVERGSTIVICGRVGSGKSALITMFAGEGCDASHINGPIKLLNCNGIAYANQDPWLFNGTIKENITFLQSFDEVKYEKVIHSACLAQDFGILPEGDQTIVGERGTQLSGGQKARVSLARALYSSAELLLFDDILSALDHDSVQRILNRLFPKRRNSSGDDKDNNESNSKESIIDGRTLIMSTHNDEAFSVATQLWLVGRHPQGTGEIILKGNVNEILHMPRFQMEIADNTSSSTPSDPDEHERGNRNENENPNTQHRVKQSFPKVPKSITTPLITTQTNIETRRKFPPSVLTLAFAQRFDMIPTGGKTISLTQESHDVPTHGWVGSQSYLQYFKRLSWYLPGLGLCMIGATMMKILGQMWLAYWCERESDAPSAIQTHWFLSNVMKDTHFDGEFGALVLLCIQITQITFYCCGISCEAFGFLNAARWWFSTIVYRVWKAPIDFFENMPIGFLLSRITKDVAVIDEMLPRTLRLWLTLAITICGAIFVMIYSFPQATPLLLLLFALYGAIQYLYIPVYRQLQRTESSLRSDLVSHLQQSWSGAPNIRAYGCEAQFISSMKYFIDHTGSITMTKLTALRWLGWHLGLIANLIVVTVSIFSMLNVGSTIGPALCGMVLSYADGITQSLNCLVRNCADVESNMISIERLNDLLNDKIEKGIIVSHALPVEAAGCLPTDAKLLAKGWPQHGELKAEGLSIQYPSRAENAITDVSFSIGAGEKFGIIGRTGSGKSSVLNAILRLVEPKAGCIWIDGIKTSDIGLHTLRKIISVIPQNPTFFQGSLRWNLDPHGYYSDDELMTALETVELLPWIRCLNERLDFIIAYGGSNVSRGQRQLLSLARALLRQPKILILDEATASVDYNTDLRIQKMIRTHFKSVTVIAIAHRQSTLDDYDLVMTLKDGKVQQIAPPSISQI